MNEPNKIVNIPFISSEKNRCNTCNHAVSIHALILFWNRQNSGRLSGIFHDWYDNVVTFAQHNIQQTDSVIKITCLFSVGIIILGRISQHNFYKYSLTHSEKKLEMNSEIATNRKNNQIWHSFLCNKRSFVFACKNLCLPLAILLIWRFSTYGLRK